jgi:hypothetical protein
MKVYYFFSVTTKCLLKYFFGVQKIPCSPPGTHRQILQVPLLQRHNNENLKEIFPEKVCAASVSISTFMRLSAIYIFPGSVCLCLLCCRKICGPILGIYINLSQTHECGNWIGTEVAQFLSGNTEMGSSLQCTQAQPRPFPSSQAILGIFPYD